MRNYMAANELNRVCNLSAFNVQGAVKRHKINQHATRYVFPDDSVMLIRTSAQLGDAWSPHWQGRASDNQLRPIQGLPVCVNKAA